MENFTKEDLLTAKSVVTQVLNNQKANSQINLTNTKLNFYNEVYTKVTTFGLSAIAFNDNTLTKVIAVLSGILTYEELKYILNNIRNIIITNHKLSLLEKEKYDKFLASLTEAELKDINYQRMEDEIRGPRK